MTKDEALKLALEALEYHIEQTRPIHRTSEAITAIHEALAEQPKVWVTPKLRPLAKLAKELDGVVADVEQGDGFDDVCLDTVKYVRDELAEQPAQQEPVAWVGSLKDPQPHCVTDLKYCSSAQWDTGYHLKYIPLYTSPPVQRKPLTDEQREVIAKGWRGRNWTLGDVIDAVEAAHGIKE